MTAVQEIHTVENNAVHKLTGRKDRVNELW